LGSARFLPATTFVANFVTSGVEPFGYHVVNLAVHLLTSLGVFRLAFLLCATPRLRATRLADHAVLFATVSALIFACHPLQTQAVTYIIQRIAAMAAMFYVWCIAAYLSARLCQERHRAAAARRRYLGCAGLAMAAVLSKENAVSLPAAVMLTEVAFFGVRGAGRLVRNSVWALPILLLPVAWKVWRWRPLSGGVESMGWAERISEAVLAQGVPRGEGLSILEYATAQITVVPRYLWLMFVPVGLNVDHDVPVRLDLSAPVVAGLILLGALCGFGVYCLRRWPLVGFGILWFFVTMSVESSFVPIRDLMMEHRVYLAMPGFSLLLAALVVWSSNRNRRAALTVATAVLLLLGGLTFARNRVWRTPLSLWRDAVAKSPNKARVHVNVGVAYHGEDNFDKAIHHYCRALALEPNINLVRDNIEIALEQQGKLDAIYARAVPRPADFPGAPPGTIILEIDVAEEACPDALR
jgi:hypothetical protein